MPLTIRVQYHTNYHRDGRKYVIVSCCLFLFVCGGIPAHHALLCWHQAVPVALCWYTAQRLHFIWGLSMKQAVQGELRCAVGLWTLLFLPGQVLLTHGIITINHRGKRRRGLLRRHDSAVEQREQKRLNILWESLIKPTRTTIKV